MNDRKKQMEQLVDTLNKARQTYSSAGKSSLSDETYDAKMLELVGLEFELGYKLKNSPTQMAGFIESIEMLKELSNGKGEE